MRRRPRLIIAEPERAACLTDSLEAGAFTTVGGDLDTLMAGLACGEPSLLAWQELERSAFASMALPDSAVPGAMRRLAEQDIEAGESAVAGVIALDFAWADPAARQALGLGPESRVLIFGTEGATDPELYNRLVSSKSASRD